MQVFESISESMEIPSREKLSQSQLDSRCVQQRGALISLCPQRLSYCVGVFIFLDQFFDILVPDVTNLRSHIAKTVTIDGVTQLELRLHFVTFRDRYISHVVAQSRDFQLMRIMPSRRG